MQNETSDYLWTRPEVTPTTYLLARWAVVAATPEESACDNRSDINCCDYCGASAIADELERRGHNVRH